MVNEHLLVLQQVKLVSVECLFSAINHHVHSVVSPELDGVALAYRPAVALFHVSGAPRYLQMMHCHGPFLCVHSRSQHRGRAEQHPYLATVHVSKEFLSRPFGLGALDKLNFIGRNPHSHQFVLDVAVDVPLVRLVGGKVAEDELCTPVGGRTHVVVVDCPCADRSLVVPVVAELVAQQAYIEGHLACHVGSDKHFCLVEIVRLRNIQPQIFPLSAVCKGDEPPDHFLLLDSGRTGKETHVFVRHVEIYHVGSTIVGNLPQEHRQFRHFDISTETLFALYRTRYVQLVIGGLFREYRRPSVETAYLLPFEFPRTQVFEHYVQFGQRIYDHRTGKERSPQVLSRAALNVPNGKQKVHRPLRALCVADARYPRVACLEHQIFIAVAFVHKYVVYAHQAEINGIIFPAVYLHLQFGELGFKVLFPGFQSFLYPAAPVAHGGLFQHFEAVLHVGQFFREYVVHGFFGLRNLAELVVCQDNAVPVVVLDF